MRLRNSFLVLAVFLSGAITAEDRVKEPYCKWDDNITGARLGVSDNMLKPRGDHASEQIAEHLPAGLPTTNYAANSSEVLLAQPDFLIMYDTDLKVALWTAHRLTRDEAAASPPRENSTEPPVAEKRADSFRSDLRLAAGEQSTCKNYKEPIFDQGHMVPNADLDFFSPGESIARSMDHSFLMSNMTPQHCAFNRGPWLVLESLSRSWASAAPETWIITGTVFDRDGNNLRDTDQAAWKMTGKSGVPSVAIPSHQYKIIVQKDGADFKTMTVLVPNVDKKISNTEMPDYLKGKVSDLTEVKQLTGLDFFVGETVAEATELWPLSGRWQPVLSGPCKREYPDF